MGTLVQIADLQEAAELARPAQGWNASALAGRLVELCAGGASAAFTQALALVREVQQATEPTAWVTAQRHAFFPPDAAACGVDLQALVVVRTSPQAIGRAADKLLRSGGFGLVVLDLDDTALPQPLLARLASLARKHRSILLCLTTPAEGSRLGSLVSLRARSERHRQGDRFCCELKVVKDRRYGPGWSSAALCRGPAGL